jgi:CheY-like chemotaxis protein
MNDKSTIKKVILADDDADDRELFSEAFSLVAPEVHVSVVKDGEELLSSMEFDAPDIVFLDLNMPKKNGYECIVAIRENEKFSRIPIVIFTTSLHTKDVDDTFRQGANYFFRKPNNFEDIKNVLVRIVHTRASMLFNQMKEQFLLTSHLNLQHHE